jgi:hypothetical protein
VELDPNLGRDVSEIGIQWRGLFVAIMKGIEYLVLETVTLVGMCFIR